MQMNIMVTQLFCSIKEAYDFAFHKPKTDIVVVGSAYAPRGTQVTSLYVRLVMAEGYRQDSQSSRR